VLTKKSSQQQQKKELQRIYKNASLVLSYGKPAIMALMGRGIGPDTAARILRKHDPRVLKKPKKQNSVSYEIFIKQKFIMPVLEVFGIDSIAFIPQGFKTMLSMLSIPITDKLMGFTMKENSVPR